MVADEIWRVLRHDYPFAEVDVRKSRDGLDHRVIGFGRRNDLQQPQVTWWIEEVCPQPVPAEVVAAALREHPDGYAGRIRADDRSWTPGGVDPLEQRAFDVDVLDYRLDNPVAVFELCQIGVEPAG